LTKISFKVILAALLLLMHPQAFALQIHGVYTATIAVPSQELGDRTEAFDEVLKNVLIKASGNESLISSAGMLSEFVPAEDFVQTYSYRENPAYKTYFEQMALLELDAMSPEGKVGAPESVVGELLTLEEPPAALLDMQITASEEPAPLPFLLEVSFSSSAIERKMHSLDIPVWGAVRPSILLWLVTEIEGERVLVGSTDIDAFMPTLNQQISKRGVPVFLPVSDLTDQTSVDIDELWGLFSESIADASHRYNADAAILMRIIATTDGLWDANWVLSLKNEQVVDSIYGVDKKEISRSFISALARQMSQRYAVSRSADGVNSDSIIRVEGVNDFDDYVHVQKYLEELPPVASVDLKAVHQNSAIYLLTLRESRAKFYQHIELGDRLSRLTSDFESTELNTVIGQPPEEFVWKSID
jgi:hypothetical protein